MSPILKVISALQFGPWNFQKLQNSPYPFPPAYFLCFQCRRCAEPSPAQWRACPATFCIALAPTRRAAPPPPLIASRWCLPCSATPPRAAAWSPPRRRRGPAKAEAAALSSRAPGHYKSPSKLIRSPFRLLLTSRPQNTPPLHRERRRAPPRRCLAIPQPLRPNRPRK